MNVSVHSAKTQLSKLLDFVEDGEEIVIERHGRPVAQLVPVRKYRRSALGAMRGQFKMTEGWERALTDEEAEAFWRRPLGPRICSIPARCSGHSGLLSACRHARADASMLATTLSALRTTGRSLSRPKRAS